VTQIVFLDAALDDLRRIGPDAVPKVLKKILILLDSPTAGHPLGGELTGFRKLVVGKNTWRVVYRVRQDKVVEICEIRAIGARADAQVYAEASARAMEAAGRHPEFRKLAEVIERLGRLTGDVAVPAATARDPVPQWLARRLIYTVGLTPQEVAALGLEEAVDRWAEFTRTGR
jgi:mRNA interferase RelE/StbE